MEITRRQRERYREIQRHKDREIQRHGDKEIRDDIKTRLLSHQNRVWPSVPQTSSIETLEEPRARQVALLS